jgi:hypothetical protein
MTALNKIRELTPSELEFVSGGDTTVSTTLWGGIHYGATIGDDGTFCQTVAGAGWAVSSCTAPVK